METLNEWTSVDVKYQKKITKSVVEMLKHPTNKYFLTLAPKHNTNLRAIKKSLNLVIKRLNQQLYGKRYMNKKDANGNPYKYIHGIVVLENAHRHNPHFHIIIRDPNGDLELKYSLREAISIYLPKTKCNPYASNGPLVGSKSWDLQECYNHESIDNRLEEYLAKDVDIRGYWNNNKPLDNIAILSVDGAAFGY